MAFQTNARATDESPSPRRYGLPMTEGISIPHPDAGEITEELIRDVVVEFYRRVRWDTMLGPVFEMHVENWDGHLARMTDFWSAALLRTGRYSGNPVEQHRAIDGLTTGHFHRWVDILEATVRELCSAREAEAFLVRGRRMRDAMTKILGIDA